MATQRMTSLALAIIVLSSFLYANLAVNTNDANAFSGRDPISIVGNADFTSANGVTGGSGTAMDPYLIEGWQISLFSAPAAISIVNTSAYYVVRYVDLTANPEFSYGIRLVNSSHGTIQDATITQGMMGLIAESCSNLTILRVTSTADYLHWARCVSLTSCSDVTVMDSNFSFARGGLWIQECSRVAIINSTMDSHNGGVPFDCQLSDNVTLRNCTVSNNEDGIMVAETPHLKLVNNTISNNPHFGLVLRASPYAEIYSNSFTGSGMSVQGTSMVDFNTHEIPSNNTVNGESILYFKNDTGIILDSEPAGQVIVTNCSAIWLSNMTIARSTVGIQVSYSSDVIIDTCQLTYQTLNGVIVSDCPNLVLWSVTTSNCWDAITLQRCPEAVVFGCSVNYSDHSALTLSNCPNAFVVNNGIVGGDTGLGASQSPNLTTEGNYIEGCYWYGFSVGESNGIVFANNMVVGSAYWGGYVSTSTITIENNSFAGSQYGLEFSNCVGTEIRNNTFDSNGQAVILGSTTSGFRVYHNNFIDNVGADGGSGNYWDNGYPSGGNYWNTLTSPDERRGPLQDQPGPDGIVDVKKPINGIGKFDRYPFTDPWGMETPPCAWLVANSDRGNTTSEFVFNASLSFDREDPPNALQVAWDWNNDGAFDTPWSTERVVSHNFALPGAYIVRLCVKDMNGAESNATESVFVSDYPPSADAGVNQTIKLGEFVTFNGSASASDLGALNYTWSFVENGVTVVLHGVSPAWMFHTQGVYPVNLTVRDSFGRTDNDTITITIESGAAGKTLDDYWWVMAAALVVLTVGIVAFIYYRTKGRGPPQA